jgi:hypothetical protein
MIIQKSTQTAGINNTSDINISVVTNRTAKDSTLINWSYNKVGDRTIPATLIPATLVPLTTNPSTEYLTNTDQVINSVEYFSNYDRKKQSFPGIVRTIGLASLTGYIGDQISIDPVKTNQKLLSIVAKSGATVNSTLRIYITNSSTVYKQIDITLPAINSEYLIDDINWLVDGTYGAVNSPTLIDGINKGTTTAVVTTVGTLPANGIYQGVLIVGTLGAKPLTSYFYNNEETKYGGLNGETACCYSEVLAKFTKELTDILCKNVVETSNVDSKGGEVSLTVQKSSAKGRARFNGVEISEATIRVRNPKVNKTKVLLNGANVVVNTTSTDISDLSYNCVRFTRTTDNLTSAQLSASGTEYYFSVNTVTNQITLPLSVSVGGDVNIAYWITTIGQVQDPMQFVNDLPGIIYWTTDSTDGLYYEYYALSFTSITADPSSNKEGDTITLTFKVSGKESLSLIATVKK